MYIQTKYHKQEIVTYTYTFSLLKGLTILTNLLKSCLSHIQ